MSTGAASHHPGWHIRIAGPEDANGVFAIYEPIVTATAISFETVPPSPDALADRIASANATHRWLVADKGGHVAGYAYATSFRARHAYRYSVETSVYVHPQHQGRGIGAALYDKLFDELRDLGYYQAYAGITLPNDASVALHVRAGFRHIGTFPDVGFKFGRWHDVSWWHRPIQTGTPACHNRGARSS